MLVGFVFSIIIIMIVQHTRQTIYGISPHLSVATSNLDH